MNRLIYFLADRQVECVLLRQLLIFWDIRLTNIVWNECVPFLVSVMDHHEIEEYGEDFLDEAKYDPCCQLFLLCLSILKTSSPS